MNDLVTAAFGAALSIVLILLARTRGPLFERRAYAAGLSTAAGVYLFFAVMNLSLHGAVMEAGGWMLFTGVAWRGWKGSTRLLAAGWALHVAWDALLHGWGGAGYAPGWYSTACVGFDLVLAAYILRGLRRSRV